MQDVTVRYQVNAHLGVICIDNPPVNALSQNVRAGIMQALEQARTDDSRLLLVLCAGRTFIAGADITEFGKPPQAPSLPDVIAALECFPKPVAAALHGTALGGGLELAMACHYRAALPATRLGLPEVKLGLLPGAGGTQRLPRLVGPEARLRPRRQKPYKSIPTAGILSQEKPGRPASGEYFSHDRRPPLHVG